MTPGKAKRKQEAIDKEGAIRGACLVRSHMNAGQDGIRDESSKQYGGFIDGHWLHRSVPRLGSIDRTHLLVILQGLASAQHGCSQVAPRVWLISRLLQ